MARPNPSTALSATIYPNLIRLMAYLHHGLSPTRAWRKTGREPSFSQFKTLMMLRHHGPSSIKLLAEALAISSAATSEMIERLVEQGLVDRRQDPADRRRVVVSLTRHAIKGVERHEALIHKRLAAVLGVLEPAQAERWAELWGELGGVLERPRDISLERAV